jgi:hypothetical protein
MKFFNKYFPHFLVIFGFVVVSLLFFYPVLQGKALSQSDIVQYTGMAKEQNDFRESEKTEPYWTNSAFGGMPTYQMGAKYPHNYIKSVDEIIRFLPRPADYLFIYFLGFYLLLLVLKTKPLTAFFGALAFGFSTYLIVILGVGHNAKAHAIAYMPAVVAGVLWVFKKEYIKGGMLTLLAAALEINANHFQMTYYLLILLLIIAVFYTYKFVKQKEIKTLWYSFGVFVLAGILAVAVNATSILATAEYTDFSIRGKSELTFNPDGTKNETNSSMKYDYITEYSYGIAESFNLIAPRLFGGSNSEKLGENSKVVDFLQTQQIAKDEYMSKEQAVEYASSGMPTYWGDQPFVGAPAYIGAVVFFLTILALYIDKRKIKYAFLAGVIVSLLLSWGKNFPLLTNFFIDFIPLYDKFRAVSSIQVIAELCMPVLAIMGLQSFFTVKETPKKWDALWKTSAICIGLIGLLYFAKFLFSFSSQADVDIAKSMDQGFVQALVADRKSMYDQDLFRSAFFILVVLFVLWLNIKNKLSVQKSIVFVGIFMITDLFFVDKNYINFKNFVSKSEVNEPFQPTGADSLILSDKSNFRVYEVQGRLQARTSYFHKSVGGYSAVRPRRMDQIFEYQIDTNLKGLSESIDSKTLALNKSNPIFDALNIKYIIVPTEGGDLPIKNPYVYGGAWFVNEVKTVTTADDEMKLLGKTNLKNTAIINKKYDADCTFSPTAIDTTARISIVQHQPNYIKYNSKSKVNSMAVFSEIYYPKGWNAYIDGKLHPHFRANYVLRAMPIPSGNHTVEFKFEPQVVKTGSRIALFSSLIVLLLFGFLVYYDRKKEIENNNL